MASVERTEASEGMRRLIGARRDLEELLAGFDVSAGTEPGSVSEDTPDLGPSSEGRFQRTERQPTEGRGGDWGLLALERRLAALEERAERAVVHLEAQSKLSEERAGARVDATIQDAVARIETMVSAAELRLAAVDAAQEREERVRERIEAARREAEERVRAAERRLVEVLGRVDALGR